MLRLGQVNIIPKTPQIKHKKLKIKLVETVTMLFSEHFALLDGHTWFLRSKSYVGARGPRSALAQGQRNQNPGLPWRTFPDICVLEPDNVMLSCYYCCLMNFWISLLNFSVGFSSFRWIGETVLSSHADCRMTTTCSRLSESENRCETRKGGLHTTTIFFTDTFFYR